MQPPAPLRWAAIIALIQAAGALVYAGLQVYWEATGVEHESVQSASQNTEYVGYGTAVFILIVFGAMGAGAISLLRGRMWGRGLIVFMQIILLGVSYFMFSGGAVVLGTATALSAVIALVMLFNPASTHWIAQRYGG